MMETIEFGNNFYHEKDGKDTIHNEECFMNYLQPLKILIYVIYHSFYIDTLLYVKKLTLLENAFSKYNILILIEISFLKHYYHLLAYLSILLFSVRKFEI